MFPFKGSHVPLTEQEIKLLKTSKDRLKQMYSTCQKSVFLLPKAPFSMYAPAL